MSTTPEFTLRETIELTTPYGKVPVVIRGFFTGADIEDIETALTEGAERVGDDGLQFRVEAMKAAGHKAMELALISVDGSSDDMLTRVRNMPGPDYRFLVNAVKEVRDSSDILPKG